MLAVWLGLRKIPVMYQYSAVGTYWVLDEAREIPLIRVILAVRFAPAAVPGLAVADAVAI